MCLLRGTDCVFIYNSTFWPIKCCGKNCFALFSLLVTQLSVFTALSVPVLGLVAGAYTGCHLYRRLYLSRVLKQLASFPFRFRIPTVGLLCVLTVAVVLDMLMIFGQVHVAFDADTPPHPHPTPTPTPFALRSAFLEFLSTVNGGICCIEHCRCRSTALNLALLVPNMFEHILRICG